MKHFSNVSGNVFQIQRWSINDGEGIRSTVFFKGCPLRCQWCANPESWNGAAEVMYFRKLCSGCGRCVQACEARGKCRGCGKCAAVCPTGARRIVGSTETVEGVLQVIKRDAVFYRESGGGVTFSGGEPFAQPEFLRQLVTACKRLGVDTAVETSGYFDWAQVKDIFALLDGVFVDIKHMDDAIHKRLTGVGNRKILANIARISLMQPNTIVRVPLIVEVNAGERNIREMCEFLKRWTRVKGVEILPYHDYGVAKREALGVESEVFTTPAPAAIDAVKRMITDYGIKIVDFK